MRTLVVSNLSRHFFRGLVLMGLALSLLLPAQASQPGCKVIDLMPGFWRVVNSTAHKSAAEQITAFRRTLVAPHSDLFGKHGLGFESAKALDAEIPQSITQGLQHEDSIASFEHLLRQQIPIQIRKFRKIFPDFECDFTVYLLPSLEQLDGAGRIIDGKPALLFGVDQIAAIHSPKDLNIFFDHELFHRYHYQVAGFSDDKAEQEVLWKGLWAEGLPTYVSMKLNPPASMQDALFLPKDLVERSQPLLAGIIAKLSPKLDHVDPELFSELFLYGGPDTTPPSRVGYYIGALVAERLAKKYSLSDLAHMQPAKVRPLLSEALADFARKSRQ